MEGRDGKRFVGADQFSMEDDDDIERQQGHEQQLNGNGNETGTTANQPVEGFVLFISKQ